MEDEQSAQIRQWYDGDGAELDGRELTAEQRAVADVFGGKAENLTISIKTNDGNTRRIVMRQGNETGAGAKHSLFRHYATNVGVITSEDIIVIPDVLANGERTEKQRGSTRLAEYKLTDANGNEFTALTEIKKGKEVFNDFYSNKKASLSGTFNTQSAHTANNNASSADKDNASSLNMQEESTRFRTAEETKQAVREAIIPFAKELREEQERAQATEDGKAVLYSIAEDAMLKDKGTEAFERATKVTMDAVERLKENGLDIEVVSQEEADAMMELADMQKRTAPETVSVQDEHLQTVVSSADGAKVLKDIDNAIVKYENSNDRTETFIGNVAKALGINAKDKSSKYATFEVKNGEVFTMRISNHNATVSNFDNAGEENGISIVITVIDCLDSDTNHSS